MPDALKPGQMGPPTGSDTPAEFADSMAAHIEAAFSDLLQDAGLPPLADDNSKESRDRRRLFVAIARGIVRHLVEHQDAFTIHVPHDTSGVTVHPTIAVEGTPWP
jgi:hypothetical protein